MNNRIGKNFYYLSVAETVSKRSTCMSKQYGAIIVKDDEIISTGYNGAPRGRENCCDRGICFRLEHGIPRGTRYEACRSLHAEMNAIISAARAEMMHSTMYIYGYDVTEGKTVKDTNCCAMCRRMIINAGIEQVVFADPDVGMPCPGVNYRAKTVNVEDWIINDESLEFTDGCGY